MLYFDENGSNRGGKRAVGDKKMKDKRKQERVHISFPVECNSLSRRNYFYTVSKDLTVEGARILSDTFISKGDSVRLNINLIDRVVALKARVAWCNRERASSRFSVGLQFVEITPQSKNAINRFLNRVYN